MRGPDGAPPGGAPNLRDRLVAAERLIAERGTAGLTVREIARAANVATGVLYNHLADKEELLALALHGHVRAVEAPLGGRAPSAGAGTVEHNLTGYLRRGLALHVAILPASAGLFPQPGVLARFAALPNPAAATMIIGACHDLVLREVGEELSVAVRPDTVEYVGTYEVPGVKRMTCYAADHRGELAVAREIAEMTWMTYADRARTSPLDQLVFDDLHARGGLR